MQRLKIPRVLAAQARGFCSALPRFLKFRVVELSRQIRNDLFPRESIILGEIPVETINAIPVQFCQWNQSPVTRPCAALFRRILPEQEESRCWES